MSIDENNANNQDNAASDSTGPTQSQSPSGAALLGGTPFSYNDWLNGRFSENEVKVVFLDRNGDFSEGYKFDKDQFQESLMYHVAKEMLQHARNH